uniref:Uncharacterized protein n=1 Tax=Glossina austeni TaxID=7395 RepID=A0A1A9V425_GLOAU
MQRMSDRLYGSLTVDYRARRIGDSKSRRFVMVAELLVLARVCGFAILVDRQPNETEGAGSKAKPKLHKLSPAWTNHIAIENYSVIKSNLRSYSLPRRKEMRKENFDIFSLLKLFCFKRSAFQSPMARARNRELYDMIANHFFCMRYIATNQIIG